MRLLPLLLGSLLLPVHAQAFTILVVGDSLSAAYGIAPEQGWVALAEPALQEENPDVTLVNASISGDTTEGGLRRLPAALERFEPDLLVIELGGNDGLRGYSTNRLQQNLVTMTELAQGAGAEVLILGMQIPSNYGPAYTSAFAATFQAVADATDAALVPFFLEPVALQPDYFQADGIHPSAEAQPLLLEHVLPELRALITEESS